MSKMEFKAKTATEALEKIANAPCEYPEYHWGEAQILIDGLHFSMSDVQDYAKATLNNQPKLSIPKRVAEFLDEGSPLYYAWTQANELLAVNDEEALKKREDEIIRRKAIVSVYLAGKALDVELVEVTE